MRELVGRSMVKEMMEEDLKKYLSTAMFEAASHSRLTGVKLHA